MWLKLKWDSTCLLILFLSLSCLPQWLHCQDEPLPSLFITWDMDSSTRASRSKRNANYQKYKSVYVASYVLFRMAFQPSLQTFIGWNAIASVQPHASEVGVWQLYLLFYFSCKLQKLFDEQNQLKIFISKHCCVQLQVTPSYDKISHASLEQCWSSSALHSEDMSGQTPWNELQHELSLWPCPY